MKKMMTIVLSLVLGMLSSAALAEADAAEYGLNRIMAHLPETSFCVIGVALLCMNLTKRLRALCLGLFAEMLRFMRSGESQVASA